MKSTIEIEIDTDDAHEFSTLEKIITGYLEKREIPYKIVIGSKRLAIVSVGSG